MILSSIGSTFCIRNKEITGQTDWRDSSLFASSPRPASLWEGVEATTHLPHYKPSAALTRRLNHAFYGLRRGEYWPASMAANNMCRDIYDLLIISYTLFSLLIGCVWAYNLTPTLMRPKVTIMKGRRGRGVAGLHRSIPLDCPLGLPLTG